MPYNWETSVWSIMANHFSQIYTCDSTDNHLFYVFDVQKPWYSMISLIHVWPNLLLFFSWQLRMSCNILAEIRNVCINDYLQDPGQTVPVILLKFARAKHMMRKLVLFYRYLCLSPLCSVHYIWWIKYLFTTFNGPPHTDEMASYHNVSKS